MRTTPGTCRFQQCPRHVAFAHATEGEIEDAASAPGSMQVRTNDATFCRREDLHRRNLTVNTSENVVIDELERDLLVST